ncbi:MAG: chemotaxis protein CheB [Acidobacteriota bacterium]
MTLDSRELSPQGAPDQSTDASFPYTPTSNSDFHIVGIGASAGGLESLERLFSNLPADTGMAFVILQHLSPDFKSLMDELLARRTTMSVRQAEHEMLVEPDSVYLLPPVKEMIIRDRRLLLSDRDPRHGLALPIDHFFRSLAQDAGERGVAVILSGSGSDGSRGIQDVRRAGGTVWCESPETAKFTGMPVSAIATGAVDRVLPPEEIALALAALARPASADLQSPDPSGDNEDGVDAILRLLRDEHAIDFSHYKITTVKRRIERRLALNRNLDLEAYVDQVRSDPRELNSLYEDLLIGVTRFFRDDEAFDALERQVIPAILDRLGESPDEQIRVWVAGCATGQEAYSIAMLLQEQLTARRKAAHVKILATDVHKASLEAASAGIYTEAALAGLSPQRIERWFTLKPNGYHVSQALRESIVFAPHNLIRDSPFTRLDLIACRNLLIYFQPHAQHTVLTLFHFALKPGGFLFLGSSESPGGLIDEFDTVDSHAKLFRKRRDIGLPPDLKLPLPRATNVRVPVPVRGSAVTPQLLAVYDRLLERCMPPSFLLDEHGQLVDSYGGVEALLKVKGRRPTHNLVDMLQGELRTVVSGALLRIRKDRAGARYEGVQLPGRAERVTVIAEPLRDPNGSAGYVLLSFGDVELAPSLRAALPAELDPSTLEIAATPAGVDVAGLSETQMRALQDELSYTKENLQTAIQELETTNEELQATNEELVASNEELQSTNEELHSVNEELYTVNAEYQKKNAELLELNDDIEHLLNGTDVATMFLDRDLRIRKFTPRIAETFQVLPQDIGRPIANFTHTLLHQDLMTDIERVLRERTTVEIPTFDRQGRSYFLRILPYRGRTKEAGPGSAPAQQSESSTTHVGVVLTLTDISALEQARARVAQLSAIVESSDDAIISKTLDGYISSWNKGAQRLYGYTAEEAIGQHVSILSPPGQRDEIMSILTDVRQGRSVEHIETVRVQKDGTLINVSVTYSPILDGSGAVVGVSAISRDITQLVRTRQELAEREERIRLLLDSTAEAIYGIDLGGVCIFCNAACARVLGYDSPAALIGRQMHPLIHHTRADGAPYLPEQSPIYEAMRHRGQAHVDNEVLWRADGTCFPAEYWSHPIVRNDEVIGAVVTFLDITERRRAEEEIQEGVRRREQFLAMLSHELRNPLAAVLSATRVLDNAAWENDACAEAAKVVKRQARHMTRLLDDLLDVSRITRGRIVLRKELTDLREAAQSAIEAMRPLLAEHDTQLETRITTEPLRMVGDSARLQQVCANLLSNASKYSPRGSRVRFELGREKDHAVLRVVDEGRGIEPELLPRIFDLFVQGDQSIARSEGGLGIGLTLLRSLVELHNGRVEAKSDGAGRGSTFTVWLPLAKSGSAQATTTRVARPVRTIVLVEDQPDALRMMQLLLESDGCEVFTAENGLEGAELIERMHPDLAIVDLGLPVMSGFDVARRIRGDRENDATLLVALSGYGQDSDVQASLDAGFDEHLTKPPDPDALERVLAGQVSSRRGWN